MFEPKIWGKEPEGWKRTYMDKYALWTQLVGCVGLELLINQILSQYVKNIDTKDLNNFVTICMARYELFSKRMDVLP